MSIHSSLRGGGKNKKHRSVLKRYERLRVLKDKNLWADGKNVMGLPKVKQQRLKVKKEAKVAAEGTSAVAGVPAKTAAPAAKAAAPAKEKK